MALSRNEEKIIGIFGVIIGIILIVLFSIDVSRSYDDFVDRTIKKKTPWAKSQSLAGMLIIVGIGFVVVGWMTIYNIY